MYIDITVPPRLALPLLPEAAVDIENTHAELASTYTSAGDRKGDKLIQEKQDRERKRLVVCVIQPNDQPKALAQT